MNYLSIFQINNILKYILIFYTFVININFKRIEIFMLMKWEINEENGMNIIYLQLIINK